MSEKDEEFGNNAWRRCSEEEMAEEEENRRYKEKLHDLQTYKPILLKVMGTFDSKECNEEKANCWKRLHSVFKMIERPSDEKPVNYKGLLKIEQILESIHEKYTNQNKSKKEARQHASLKKNAENYDSESSTSSTLSSFTLNTSTDEKLNEVYERYEKVPQKTNAPSNKISMKVKNSKLKRRTNVFDSLFTPDQRVSKVQTGTSQDYSRSFEDSEFERPRMGPQGERTRHSNSFSPRGPYQDHYGSFKTPRSEDHYESFRTPHSESGIRHKLPYVDFAGRYIDSKANFTRTPYKDNEPRYKQSHHDTELRYRAPYHESSSRYRAPYRESTSRYRAPYPDTTQRYRPHYDRGTLMRALHRPQTGDSIRVVTYLGDIDALQDDRKPRFTDQEEKYYEKPKDVRKFEKAETVTTGAYSSKKKPYEESVASQSTLTIDRKERKFEKAETVTTGAYSSKKKSYEESVASQSTLTIDRKEKRQGTLYEDKDKLARMKYKDNSTTATSPSSDISVKSSFSKSCIPDSLKNSTLEETDLEKLNQSTQKLKSNLNNRLKNMKAKQLLMSNMKVTTTSSGMAVKDLEESSQNDITQEKCLTSDENVQQLTTSETTDSFIDQIMSNLTTKFGPRRGHMIAKQTEQTENPSNLEVAIGSNSNLDKCLDDSQLKSCRSNNAENKPELKEINHDDANITATRIPMFLSDNQDEIVMRPKQILSQKAQLLAENSAKTPIVSNDISFKNQVSESIEEKQLSDQTMSADSDSHNNNIQIPCLDGIIPSKFNETSVSSNESTTKDQSPVTNTSKSLSNQSSLKNPLNEDEEEKVLGSNVLNRKIPSNPSDHKKIHHNQKCVFSQNDECNKTINNQSLRAKLTGEIRTFHKVGTPCGGALRGRIERDKMMPSGQIASLKPGALFDLLGEEKPTRSSTKVKPRPPMPNNNEIHHNVSDTSMAVGFSNEAENSQPSTQIKNPDDILSKLSESDLRKIIQENIEALAIPPNLPFLNNFVSTNTNNDNTINVNSTSVDVNWRNQANSLQLTNENPQSVNLTNKSILPDSISNNQMAQQYQSNWVTYDNNSWKNNTISKDPRQKSQIATNVEVPNHHAIEDRQPTFRHFPDPGVPSFENANYKSGQEQVFNDSTEQSNAYSRRSLLRDPPLHFESRMICSREGSQRPAFLCQRPTLGDSVMSNKRESYPNFLDSQQSRYYNPRHFRRTATTYAEWKAEKNMAENRNHNNFQMSNSSQYYNEKSVSDHRNFNRYRWTSETPTNSYNQRGNHYNEPSSKNQQKESDTTKKLSARDPRRRSTEDKFDRNESFSSTIQSAMKESHKEDWSSKSPINSSEQVGKVTHSIPPIDSSHERPSQRDTNIQERTHSRGRLRNRDQGYQYGPRNRSLSRGRKRSPYRESSPSRYADKSSKSFKRQVSKDTYTSPLEKLYAETPPAKTGLGYGAQKFRIPKINKGSFNDIKVHTLESPYVKGSTGANQHSINVPNIETAEKEADDKTSEDDGQSEAFNALEKSCNKQNQDSDGQQIPDKDQSINVGTNQDKRSRSDENSSCDDTASPVEESELPSCRRSKRIMKRNRGRSSKTLFNNLNFNEEEKSSDGEQRPSADEKIKKDEDNLNLIKQLSESKSMKSLEGNEREFSSVDDDSVFYSDKHVHSIKSHTKHGIINNPIGVSNDKTLQERERNTHENPQNILPNTQSSINLDNKPQGPYVSGSETTCCAKNDETAKFTANNKSDETGDNSLKINKELSASGTSHLDKSLATPETAEKLSEVESEICNKSDVDSTTPKIKIIKQVELLEDVIGIKLTPDKIRKVAELLYTSEVKRNTDDVQPESQISETNDPAELAFSNKLKRVENESVEACGLQKLQPRDEEKNETCNQKPKRKYKNELDRLQDDISKYHDSEAIAAASGPRQCRLQKEKHHQSGNKAIQKTKNKLKKNIEDGFDESKKTAFKNKSNKTKAEFSDEEDFSNPESDKDGVDDNSTEPIENQYSESNSSDDIYLYSEKMKTKYSFVLEEEEREKEKEQVLTEKNTVEVDGIVKSRKPSISTTNVESNSSVINRDNSNENTGSSIHTSNDSKLDDINPKCSEERSDNVKMFTQPEPSTENLIEREPDSVNEEIPIQIPPQNSNLSNKIGLRKQRKKSSWSAGIVKKKYKSKKNSESNKNEDGVDTLELEMENQEIEDIDINETCDVSYYQEGESRPISCKLCSFIGKSIVTHYAITHPKDEVLISRMSPEAAEIAKKESEKFFSLCDEGKKNCSSQFECRICYFKSSKFSVFFEHMALHTGEFRHECCKCGYRTSTRSGILKHFLSHNLKNSNIKSCRVLYKEPMEKTYFCGYLCALCNYFQISERNLKRHVENLHDSQDFGQVIKINLSKVKLNEFDFNIGTKSKSSVNIISNKTLTEHKDSSTNKIKQIFEDDLENQLKTRESINEEVAGTSCEVSKLILKNTPKRNKESVENRTSADSTFVDTNMPKDSRDVSAMNESVMLHNNLSADTIINSEKNTTEIYMNVQFSDTVEIRKENTMSLSNSDTKNESVDKDNVSLDSTLVEIQNPSVEMDSEENFHIASPFVLTVERVPEINDVTSNTSKNESLNVVDLGNKDIVDPVVGKEQPHELMLIEEDWLIDVCKNINELHRKYLIENANDSVTSRVDMLKAKSTTPNILNEIVKKLITPQEDTVLLNQLIENYVQSNLTRKLNISSSTQENYNEYEVEDDVPARRQLRDRTCKGGITKQANDQEKDNTSYIDDDDDDEGMFELFQDFQQLEDDWDEDLIAREELALATFTSDSENSEAITKVLQPLPCLSAPLESYINKNVTRNSLSIQDKLYVSSLPRNSNLSEFTHVMKQISSLILKLLEEKEVQVGGLKAITADSGLVFSCSLKTFNKDCGFQTSDLENFGRHVNMLHHTSYWNGICCTCKTHFVQDPNSHDKTPINTQSKAFCHLVRQHVIFIKKSSKSLSRDSLSTNEESVSQPSPVLPRLRVRRFSGDKLSGTDAENGLHTPAIEVSGCEEANTHPLPSLLHSPNESEPPSLLVPKTKARTSETCLRAESGIIIKKFKLPIDMQDCKVTLKIDAVFNAMCAHDKLRHLYKCMGMECDFTTSSMKEFALHIDSHQKSHLDTHNDFWSVCAYCLTPHATSKDLAIHIRKEHAVCLMQCSNCFYRAKSIANVHFHHTIEHVGGRFMVLQCEQFETNLPQFIEKPFTDYVSAFRCNLKDCSVFTYMLNTFLRHVQSSHPDRIVCHMCSQSFPILNELIKHYCDKHGMGNFQCLFCTFGACKEEEIRLHLCYAHPNFDPKALQRTENAPQETGTPKRECIKRIMFYKDEDQLYKFVNVPPTLTIQSPEEGSVQPQSTLPTNLSDTQNTNLPMTNSPTIASADTPVAGVDSSAVDSTQQGAVASTSAVDSTQQDAVASTSAVDSTQQVAVASTSAVDSTQLDPVASSSPIDSTQQGSPNSKQNEPSDPFYFRCGNKGCDYAARNSRPLKQHLSSCQSSYVYPKLICPTCNKEFKHTNKYLEHLSVHGPEIYSCALCPFKASRLMRVKNHMKVIHQFLTTNVLPVCRDKIDPEQDFFVVHGKERKKTKRRGPNTKSKLVVKTKFSPHEIDIVPKAAIFLNSLGCQLCPYETKVRSNLLRHIQRHASGDIVTQEEFVNPVPQKTEKMFDKMMNLAGSSHKKKIGPENSKDETFVECPFKYVPDQDRYKCHVEECGYRTLSETMLKDHISIIHQDETHYMCPHCSDLVDAAPISIDQLSMHLKLHDSPVYKCVYCEFCSHIRRSIERHTEVVHPGEQVDAQVVRLSKPDQTFEQPARKFYTTDKPNEQGDEWFWCNLCLFKTKKKKIILQHGETYHKMAKPYMCSTCGYQGINEQILIDHCSTYHPEEEKQVISLYKEVTEVKKAILPPIPPLWKRDAKRLKLIRGITLDEKGDAPPPVATAPTGIDGLDRLELKFGHFGLPSNNSFMCPRCLANFVCKSRQEMKEHLYKDLQYSPIFCKICKTGSTMRSKIMKHVNKVHNMDWEHISKYIEIKANEELESWVEKVLSRQQSLMNEMPATEETAPEERSRKRRRSSETTAVAPPQAYTHTLSDESSPLKGIDTIPPNSDENKAREKRKRDKCPSRHRFTCKYCAITTKYKHSIILHCKKVHPDLKPQAKALEKTLDEKVDAYNCMYCNCTALNMNTLKHHWITTHRNSGLNFLFRNTIFNTEIDYQCYWCKKISDLESLEEHCRDEHSVDQRFLVIALTVIKYKCPECKVLFKSVDLLKSHFSLNHPSKKLCYIVVNVPKSPVSSPNHNSPFHSKQPDTYSQSLPPKSIMAYKCFNCPFTSSQIWLVVKHMREHFVTFVCAECSSWFTSSAVLDSHMQNKHPSSSAKQKVLKGSDADIENAKKNIIVILESGVKRKITKEELTEAETDIKDDEDMEIYTYDEPLEEYLRPPQIKETARKSTGCAKHHSAPPTQTSSLLKRGIQQESPKKRLKYPFKLEGETTYDNTFVTVPAGNKTVRFPSAIFRKLIDCDPQLNVPNVI